MKQSTILALDLGTKMGWAVKKWEILPIEGITHTQHTYDQVDVTYDHFDKRFIIDGKVSGWVDFSNKRFEGGGMRYLRFMKWLDEMRDNLKKIDEVYFEEVRRHMGVDAAHAYGGFMAQLTSWCEKNCIPYQGVPVKTIKKHITGKGNANKQMVLDAVKSRGYDVSNDNEADALALLIYVKER